jgi:hypothetical protein
MSDAEVLGVLFAAPFFIGCVYGAHYVANFWTSVHPVIRILLVLGASGTVVLGAFRAVRVLYALAVAAVGTVVVVSTAPDLLWKLFFEAVLILGWGVIALSFEAAKAAKATGV